jgi:hypothetical protein
LRFEVEENSSQDGSVTGIKGLEFDTNTVIRDE